MCLFVGFLIKETSDLGRCGGYEEEEEKKEEETKSHFTVVLVSVFRQGLNISFVTTTKNSRTQTLETPIQCHLPKTQTDWIWNRVVFSMEWAQSPSDFVCFNGKQVKTDKDYV